MSEVLGVIGFLVRVAGLLIVMVWAFFLGHSYGGPVLGVFSVIFFSKLYVIVFCLIRGQPVGDLNPHFPGDRFYEDRW